MRSRKKSYLVWVVLMAFSSALVSSCATPAPPKPKVVVPAAAYPNAVTVAGVTVAAVPFDPHRDVYAAPNEPLPRKPDFNWFKAGVCPTRLIFSSEADVTYVVNPLQITCTDARGITYKSYDAREAGDAVAASEAFAAHVQGALTGTIFGAALGAGLGAAVGGIAGGGGAAARGAAIGATFGGVQGLIVGTAGSPSRTEARIRHLLHDKMLRTQKLSRGMSCDGLVYFPAVPIISIRVVLAEAGGPTVQEVKIPVVLPPQVVPPEAR
ncbi:MAG: hypothetical protein A2Z73_04705 [Deltaproteobacteria bacterium RBG_13_60_28]|nr:MAG: hypothetical protein A2Z73_04705 [Deltaproteobacteria bacterium RBG_13_60_28]